MSIESMVMATSLVYVCNGCNVRKVETNTIEFDMEESPTADSRKMDDYKEPFPDGWHKYGVMTDLHLCPECKEKVF